MGREVDSRCRRESEAAGSNDGEFVSITWASRLQSSLKESESTDYLSRSQFSEFYDQKLFDQDPLYKMYVYIITRDREYIEKYRPVYLGFASVFITGRYFSEFFSDGFPQWCIYLLSGV